MKKPRIAVELTSTCIKIVVGYVLDNKVQISYTLTKPYGYSNQSGVFIDEQSIRQALSSLKTIIDPSANVRLPLDDVLLVLPPHGLQVFTTTQVTTILGEGKKTSKLDIRNLYQLVKISDISKSTQMVNIVPETFTTSDGYVYEDTIPYDAVTNALSMMAKVLTLPKNIPETFQKVFNDCGINISKAVVAPFAAGSLISSYENMPVDYFLVDIGSHETTVSVIGHGTIYGSRTIMWGGSNITEKILETFNITESDAEKYKIIYGLDKTQMNFKAPICTSEDGNGELTPHYTEELNAIIKKEVESFSKELRIAVDEVLEGSESTFKRLPMILIGGTSQLNGLVELLTPKVESETVTSVAPLTLGARNPGLFNCLGAIYANEKYDLDFEEDSHINVNAVTRKGN